MSIADLQRQVADAVHGRDGVEVTLVTEGGDSRKVRVTANAGGIRPRDGDGGRTGQYELVLTAAKADYPRVEVNKDLMRVPAEWLGVEASPAGEQTVLMRVTAILGDRYDPGAWRLQLRRA